MPQVTTLTQLSGREQPLEQPGKASYGTAQGSTGTRLLSLETLSCRQDFPSPAASPVCVLSRSRGPVSWHGSFEASVKQKLSLSAHHTIQPSPLSPNLWQFSGLSPKHKHSGVSREQKSGSSTRFVFKVGGKKERRRFHTGSWA